MSHSLSRREIMRMALSGQAVPPEVPIWEIEFHGWNSFSRKKVVLGRAFEALTPAEQEKALHQNAEIFCTVAEELCFHGVTMPSGYWEVAPDVPAYFWLPGEARFKQAEITAKMADGRFMLVGNCGGTIGIPHSDKYLEFSYLMYDTPEKVDEMAAKAYSTGLANLPKWRDAGVEAVFTASDIADNHGVFFPPELFDRFFIKNLRNYATEVRKAGLFLIQHTDGNINTVLEVLADSGIHALQAIDPVAGMDIRDVKKRVGERLTLCGNVDCGLLLTGKPENIYNNTLELIRDCRKGGRFVLGASNAVQQEAPAANYRAMIDAWKL